MNLTAPSSPYNFDGVLLSDKQIQARIRTLVAADLEKIRRTIGSSIWLANLTDREFEVIITEILPAITQARNQRK
jgi:hypothetical protein